MAVTYVRIELYTSEEAHIHGIPVYDVVAKAVRDAKVAARCLVTKGIAGSYESGELVSHRILDLAVNLPVKVEIVAPAAEEELLLELVAPLVADGILLVSRPELRVHRAARPLLPKNLRVRDLMTARPVSVGPDTAAGDVARLLITREFNAIPVVDADGGVLGIVSEGDLIERAALPLRVGLLSGLDEPARDQELGSLAALTAAQVMTASPVTAREDEPVRTAVDRLLDRGLKRLPVVDEAGRLVGMLSRVDIFRGATGHAPDWRWFAQRGVEVTPAVRVIDLPLQDTPAVRPDASLLQVLERIDNDSRRVAVVDTHGRLVGLISDRDLLPLFREQGHGPLRLLRGLRSAASGAEAGERLASVPAADVMERGVVSVATAEPIEEALRLMTEHRLKRLPVLDEAGRYRGMLTRDAMLRAACAR